MRRAQISLRNISAVDRLHYTAVDRDGWRCAPGTCIAETELDERTAAEVTTAGLEILPREMRLRALALWETARSRAEQKHHVTLDAVQEPLLALIQGRISLVTDDPSLQRAREGTAMLIDLMMRAAKDRGWSQPAEFFLNFALANRRHLFPFTD